MLHLYKVKFEGDNKMHRIHSIGIVSRFIIVFALCAVVTVGVFFAHDHMAIAALAHPAHAAVAGVSIKPASGAYSNKLITVTGSGYAGHETVQVYWNYTGPGTGTLETSTTTGSGGAFTARFAIPLAATGIYTIAGVGLTSGLVATGTFKLLPSITAPGSVGVAGLPLTIHGYAFGANETVNLYWNYVKGGGTFVTGVTGDSNGSFTTTITVPSSPSSGFSTLGGVGQSSNTTATYPLTIYAQTLALAPLSGAANSTLTMSAYGFEPNEAVNIYWNNGTVPVLTSSTDTVGYMAPLTFTVPAGTAPGAYQVSAVGQTSNATITNIYTVVAAASSLSSASAPVGTQVIVTGQGYSAGEPVSIVWNYSGPGTGTTLTTVNAGFSGTISATITIPTTITGAYQVAAVGGTSLSVSQNTFTVSNGLATSPVKASPGANVVVTGMGYQANESVNIYWNTTSGSLLATATADTNGNISQTVAIPTNATIGNNTIVGVGQTSQLSFTASITASTDWGDFGVDYSNHRFNAFEQQVSAANVANLISRWRVTFSKPVQSSPVAANGLIYITAPDGQLSAYKATSGKLAWRYNSNSGFPNYSSALVDPTTNMVFFGTLAQPAVGLPSPFYALNATTGTLEWSLILPWDDYGFPTLAMNTVYVGTSDEAGVANAMAIDEMSGHVNWAYATQAGVWGAFGADPSQNMVFTGIGNPTDAIIAFNATTGALIWQYNIPQYGPDNDVGSAITVDNGRVYADSKNGYFYALNESDGSLAWSTLIGTRSGGNISSSALANGIIYVGSRDKNLYALRESDGSIVWKTPTGSDIFSSPAVANGVVYVASLDKKFYAMDATSGAVLWSFTTGSRSFSSPILVNGYLYCASTDHKLYAFALS